MLAGHTEFLRACRTYAGIYHFVYLTSSNPGAITSDNFINIEELTLEAHFADYVKEAFKPLGVYLNFWQATLKPSESKRFTIMVINDEYERKSGQLTVSFEDENGTLVRQSTQGFSIPPLGQHSFYAETTMLVEPGNYLIKAIALYENALKNTVSRRKVTIE